MTAMLKQFLLTAAFSALALGAALAAEPASLSGDELRKADGRLQAMLPPSHAIAFLADPPQCQLSPRLSAKR
jgi:hypothetical protein